nr:hypothetical protein CFP56_40555 [Quercus suber]
MTTRFSNAKLTEAQEEKAKAGLTSGLLLRKRQRENEPSKEETVMTSSMATPQDRRLALPTSSLELIVFPGGGSKAKTISKISIASFWEDAGIAAISKQIDEALKKVEKAGLEAVEKFKALDEFLDKFCDYYVDDFELFHKYLAKHHLEMDFSKLDMEEVEKEILVDHPTEAADEK